MLRKNTGELDEVQRSFAESAFGSFTERASLRCAPRCAVCVQSHAGRCGTSNAIARCQKVVGRRNKVLRRRTASHQPSARLQSRGRDTIAERLSAPSPPAMQLDNPCIPWKRKALLRGRRIRPIHSNQQTYHPVKMMGQISVLRTSRWSVSLSPRTWPYHCNNGCSSLLALLIGRRHWRHRKGRHKVQLPSLPLAGMRMAPTTLRNHRRLIRLRIHMLSRLLHQRPLRLMHQSQG